MLPLNHSGLDWVNVDCLGWNEQSLLDERRLVSTLEVHHHYLFLLAAVLLKDMHLNFEILFVIGLRRIEVTFSVKTYRLDVFLIDGFGVLFVEGFTGFGDSWFDSNHCFEINIKSIIFKNY
jgi:hypothetical protein